MSADHIVRGFPIPLNYDREENTMSDSNDRGHPVVLTEPTIGGTWHEAAMERLAKQGKDLAYSREDYLVALSEAQGSNDSHRPKPGPPSPWVLRRQTENAIGALAAKNLAQQYGDGNYSAEQYTREYERLAGQVGAGYRKDGAR